MTLAHNYRLVHVTEKDVVNFTRSQNGASWRGALTLDQYVTRELVLSKGKLIKQLMVFILEDSRQTKLASIELLVRDATRYSYDGARVVRQAIQCGSIGGVFTYPDHRGKGLAKVMVDELMDQARSTLVGSHGFTFLYSEIGDYYERNGFVSEPVALTHIPVNAANKTSIHNDDDLVSYIGYHEFEPYFELYRQRYEEEITKAVTNDHKPRVSANITLAYADWFHLRAKYISYHLFHQKPKINFESSTYEELVDKFLPITPQIFGLKISVNNRTAGFIVWTYDWDTTDNQPANKATVIRLHVEPGFDKEDYTWRLLQHTKRFLEQQNAKGELATTGFVKIVVWDSDTTPQIREKLEQLYDAKTGIVNTSRSAIHFHSPDDQKKYCNGELVWANNNKLTWF